MANEVKVCMTGTGGDETFGNYGKWRPYENLTHAMRQAFGATRRDPRWLANFFRFRKGSRYSISFLEFEKRSGLFAPNFANDCESTEQLIETMWKDEAPQSARDAVRFIDQRIQLPDEFLHMTDRFSMAFSVEARPPLLDRQFHDAMMSIPSAIRIGEKHLKEHFIAAVRDLLPTELILAPKKGFVLPIGSWLGGRLKDQVFRLFSRSYLRNQGIFSENLLDCMIRPHLEVQGDRTSQVWTLFMFQLWWDQCNCSKV
jgi:asparagine synthase (glutamine-hydrolysing)